MFMNIELSKKNIGTGMGLFSLAVAFVDPLLGLFFLVLTVTFLLFWHRHEERGALGHFSEIHSAEKLENLMRALDLARSKGRYRTMMLKRPLASRMPRPSDTSTSSSDADIWYR
jgi:hypothetical protein